MFKVGDRVAHDEFGPGVVKYIVEESVDVEPYFIEFDNPHDDLHSGGWRGYNGKPNSCYWFGSGPLKKKTTFKGNK